MRIPVKTVLDVGIVLTLALALAVCAMLSGCASNTRSDERRVMERIETPTPDGGRIVRETEKKETNSDTVTKADLGAAVAGIQAAVAAMQGNIPGAVAALVPKPNIPTAADLAAAVKIPEPSKILGMDTTDLIATAAALWASERGVAAWHKRRRLKPEKGRS